MFVDYEGRMFGTGQIDCHSAGLVPVIPLHVTGRQSMVSHKLDQFVTQLIAPDTREDNAVQSQLPGMKGDVCGCSARPARVRKTVPEQFAYSDNDRLI